MDSDKFPEFQNAFIEKLKGKVGSNNLYIALVVENPDDFDVYHFYYYITTRNASNNVTFENGAIGKVIILWVYTWFINFNIVRSPFNKRNISICKAE